MRAGQTIGVAGIILTLTACPSKEPVTIYKTKEVMVEVTKPCKHPEVQGIDESTDLAPRDSNYYEVVQYLVARIYALRSWAQRLTNSIEACDEQ